jgi:hypothetical protein
MDKEVVKRLAEKAMEEVEYSIKPTAIETLRTVKFSIPIVQSIDQTEIAQENQFLGLQGCLGRLAFSGVVVEKHFPNVFLEAAEVWHDFFREILLEKLKENPWLGDDQSFMRELLMYEEPHMVLNLDGKQFDPLENEFGERVIHPRVQTFPFWEAVTSSYLVSKAWLEEDIFKKLDLLEKAEEVCPETTLVRENMVHVLTLLGRDEEALETLLWVHERRPCARSFFVLSEFTQEESYREILFEIYGGPNVINFF